MTHLDTFWNKLCSRIASWNHIRIGNPVFLVCEIAQLEVKTFRSWRRTCTVCLYPQGMSSVNNRVTDLIPSFCGLNFINALKEPLAVHYFEPSAIRGTYLCLNEKLFDVYHGPLALIVSSPNKIKKGRRALYTGAGLQFKILTAYISGSFSTFEAETITWS